jgi:hypothetical protein
MLQGFPSPRWGEARRGATAERKGPGAHTAHDDPHSQPPPLGGGGKCFLK